MDGKTQNDEKLNSESLNIPFSFRNELVPLKVHEGVKESNKILPEEIKYSKKIYYSILKNRIEMDVLWKYENDYFEDIHHDEETDNDSDYNSDDEKYGGAFGSDVGAPKKKRFKPTETKVPIDEEYNKFMQVYLENKLKELPPPPKFEDAVKATIDVNKNTTNPKFIDRNNSTDLISWLFGNSNGKTLSTAAPVAGGGSINNYLIAVVIILIILLCAFFMFSCSPTVPKSNEVVPDSFELQDYL